MSQPTLYVVTFEQAQPIEKQLIEIINRGYDKPRFKYNVIKTPRVKYSLIDDFGVKDPTDIYLMICVAPTTGRLVKVDPEDNAKMVTEKLQRSYPTVDLTNMTQSTDLSQILDPELSSRVLGTIACRIYDEKHGKDREITAFTSFYRGVGSQLMSHMVEFCKEKLDCDRLWIDVISEHELREYYERQGFVLQSVEYCPIDPETGLMAGMTLEDGLRAAQDFHVDVMSRDI